MNRSTPMKRTAWPRRLPHTGKRLDDSEQNKALALVECAPVAMKKIVKSTAVMAKISDLPHAIPKQSAIRSEPYRRLVAACTVDGCQSPLVAKGYCNKHYLRVKLHGTTDLPKKLKKTAGQILEEGSVKQPNGCLQWTKTLREGYGRLAISGKTYSAHVLSWKLIYGDIPDGLQLNHKCHNRACINVDHLYLGTQRQNMEDMRNAGRERRPKGKDFSTTKLDEVNVLAIRSSSKSAAALAREYEVSESLIRAVRARQAWAWVEDVGLARPKQNAARSEEYRRLVASMSCKACGIQDYSQAAHVPPDGKGIKQDDREIFALCCTRLGINGCHVEFDQFRMFPKRQAVTVGKAWAADTRRQIEAEGKWPKNLPKWSEE